MTNLGGASEDLSDYLREIALHPLLTPQEEIELSQQMLEGSCEERERARRRLIESNLRLVVSVARRYRGQGLGLADLIQEGNIGLQTGVSKFDWRKGFRLSTYVYWWIRQAMTRALANDSRLIRLPVHAGELLREASQTEQRLTAELGIEPSLPQVAASMHMQPDRLRKIRLAASVPASLDVPVGVDGDRMRAETVADDAAQAAMQSVAETDDLPATVSTALEALPEREREVLRWRYGLARDDTSSLVEIGKRLGITRERARQIESQALRRLRKNAGLRRAMLEHASA
jgi:RNA polymerase primary sigma factor